MPCTRDRLNDTRDAGGGAAAVRHLHLRRARQHAAADRRAAGRLHLYGRRRGLAAHAAARDPRSRCRRRLRGRSARRRRRHPAHPQRLRHRRRDQAPGGIAAVRNPAQRRLCDRPARFLRIEKAVSQPDEDTRDVPNTAFGPNRAPLRHARHPRLCADRAGWLGEGESAGERRVRISVLDANGRRLPGTIGSRHTNWLQVVPGEELECNGCHNPNANPPFAHGRSRPDDVGEHGRADHRQRRSRTRTRRCSPTWARRWPRSRNRVMCGGACEPSVDIVFDDYWRRGADHARGEYRCVLPRPARRACRRIRPIRRSQHVCATRTEHAAADGGCVQRTTGAALCRITIHYETAHSSAVERGPLRRCEHGRRAGPRPGDGAADQPQVHDAVMRRSTRRTPRRCRPASSI